MIDLHCHILPGVDDGARDLAEAVMMGRIAAGDGCEVIVATPHQRHPYWWNEERAELERLRETVQLRLGTTPRVLPGAEIRVDPELLAELDRFPDGGLIPLAGSRYLLLELDRQGLGPDPQEVLHEVIVAGWRPILAHPEVYPWLTEQPGLLGRLVEMGVLIQVTSMSVTGGYGRSIETATRALLDSGWVHFVASDAHGLNRRPPGLGEAYRAIAAGWGEETARALLQENPCAVIENRPLPKPVCA